jgi:precorrin-2/cobalt-factor-2 C20-methyltransferase
MTHLRHATSGSTLERRDPERLRLSQPAPQLTLVGVGPGDPQLLTIAAVKAIEAATVVAFPVARLDADGMAARIAAPWIGSQQRRLPLLFPMVVEAEPRREAWHQASDALAAELAAGETVVLLCEGDSSLYASCSYVLLALAQNHPRCAVRVIPGITAVAAAAAAASSTGLPWPLALQQESLLIRPTPETAAEFEHLLDQAAASGTVLALLKLGHRWSWVQPLLAARGLLDQALFAQRVGWPDQLVVSAEVVSSADQPYFSLLMIRQGWPAVLP